MRQSKAIDLLGIAAAIVAAILMGSCAPRRAGLNSFDPARMEAAARPAAASDRRTIITGKVKIDFPEYRIRGSCRIVSEPGGTARIDFIHSSLFGSYREDATLHIGDGGIFLEDHERNDVWTADSTLDLMRRISGFDIRPDDLLFVLLLAVPESTGEGSIRMLGGGAKSDATGVWRGREIELSRDDRRGTTLFRQCLNDISVCYTARYAYNDGRRYPARIVLERDPGGERISLTVSDVREEEITARQDINRSPLKWPEHIHFTGVSTVGRR